jgi:hypothetical protein
MANPYATMFPQLIGAATSIAGAIPNKQDKLQRRIAMGGEDPAMAAVRRQLAAQNAQTAMAVANSQQGVNPALAQRNAQQALAQQQVQTNADIARMNAASAQQARQSDPMGRKIAGIAQGAGQLANVFGTALAAQNAGKEAGKPESAAGLASPVVKESGSALPAPVRADTAINNTLARPAMSPETSAAVDQVTQGYSGSPQDVLALPSPGPLNGNPQDMMDIAMDEARSGVAGPAATDPSLEVFNLGAQPVSTSTASQFQPSGMTGTGMELDTSLMPGNRPMTSPRTWAYPEERPITAPAGVPMEPMPQESPIQISTRPSDQLGFSPEFMSNQQNQGLLQTYDEAMSRGDTETARVLQNILSQLSGF